MTAPNPLDGRVVELETQVMYLQQEVHELNDALLSQQQQLDLLQKVVARMNHQLERLGEGEELRSPEIERPPHY